MRFHFGLTTIVLLLLPFVLLADTGQERASKQAALTLSLVSVDETTDENFQLRLINIAESRSETVDGLRLKIRGKPGSSKEAREKARAIRLLAAISAHEAAPDLVSELGFYDPDFTDRNLNAGRKLIPGLDDIPAQKALIELGPSVTYVCLDAIRHNEFSSIELTRLSYCLGRIHGADRAKQLIVSYGESLDNPVEREQYFRPEITAILDAM